MPLSHQYTALMGPLSEKKIVLGVTAGIAAYKTPDLVRLLKKAGAQIQIVLTDAARQFVTKETLRVVSQNKVHDSLWDPNEDPMTHIKLARWADLLIIAPCTAHCLAKLAHGFADDLLGTLYLAYKGKTIIAPAMNTHMWQHPSVQKNVAQLQTQHCEFWGPAKGEQACGDYGEGRMLEPSEISERTAVFFQEKSFQRPLSGKRIVITAGPTRESIDPVRYISNRSSGKMGFALAEVAETLGAEVILISGPSTLECSPSIQKINVTTALEMHKKSLEEAGKCDIFIAAAAVSDYRIEHISTKKIKKNNNSLTLNLVRNPDVISEVASLPHKPITIGFAAETENLIENAKEKLKNKKLDLIIANQVGETLGFDSDQNAVFILSPDETIEIKTDSKKNVANKIWGYLVTKYL